MSSRDPDSPLSTPNSQLSTLLLRGVDAGLVGTLFLVPLAMGGRSAIGQSALAILTFWTAACWCLRCLLTARPDWWWSWAEPVVLAAVGLVVLQIVPLPPNVVQFLSPHLYERLPLWAPGGEPAARLGVCVDIQPAWYYKDGDGLAEALGARRLENFIGVKTWRQAGVKVALAVQNMGISTMAFEASRKGTVSTGLSRESKARNSRSTSRPARATRAPSLPQAPCNAGDGTPTGSLATGPRKTASTRRT